MNNIGAKDRIDKLLVQKYANERMNNIEADKAISADKAWNLMGLTAQYHKAAMMNVKSIKEKVQKIEQVISKPVTTPIQSARPFGATAATTPTQTAKPFAAAAPAPAPTRPAFGFGSLKAN